jgi:hypothetical protein
MIKTLALGTLLALCSGCLAAAGGAAYLAHESLSGGWYGRRYDATFDKVVAAAVAALDELKMAHGAVPRAAPKSEFTASTSDDTVYFEIKSETAAMTGVWVRVGLIGDDGEESDLSTTILRKIDEKMK